MPWLLSTPLSTGDLDTGAYAEVKIVSVSHRSNQNLIMVGRKRRRRRNHDVTREGIR